jgi:hypothetical protein
MVGERLQQQVAKGFLRPIDALIKEVEFVATCSGDIVSVCRCCRKDRRINSKSEAEALKVAGWILVGVEFGVGLEAPLLACRLEFLL